MTDWWVGSVELATIDYDTQAVITTGHIDTPGTEVFFFVSIEYNRIAVSLPDKHIVTDGKEYWCFVVKDAITDKWKLDYHCYPAVQCEDDRKWIREMIKDWVDEHFGSGLPAWMIPNR